MKLFKSKEYKYFERKLEGVRNAILDQEFKRFKTLEIREEIRKDYDTKKSLVAGLIENIKSDKPKEEIARFEDEKIRAEETIKRFEGQLKLLDKEVFGLTPSAEEPDGYNGIDQTLESLHELVEMIQDYMGRL